MEFVGIRNGERGWFKEFLNGHTQRTRINSVMSEREGVRCAVPQGSTLGPLLYLIYINDLLNYMKCHCTLFAADTVLYTSSDSEAEASRLLQKNVNTLILWTRHSQLTMNANKCKVMTIPPSNRGVAGQSQLSVGSTRLEEVSNYKYLGLTLDTKLKCKAHINLLIRNISHKTYILSKLQPKLTEFAAITLF